MVSRHTLKHVLEKEPILQLHSSSINPVSVVRDLVVLLDSELTMKQHVTEVASSC